MATATKKRKRNKSQDSTNKSDPPVKKARKIRQTYLDSDSVISSLQFHPTTHTFAASCFDGKINLYQIDEVRTTQLTHTLHHPNHNNNTSSDSQSLKELIKSNKQKMERLKQLQIKNNQKLTPFNESDNSDSDIDSNSDALSTISLNSEDFNLSKQIPCKHTLFNHDGSIIFGAWSDSEIAMFDYSKQTLIHHFNNNSSNTDNEKQLSKLSTIKMYNRKTIVTGDIDGIIRCWDIRMNLNQNNKSQRQYQYSGIKISQLHNLAVHEDGINCFESIAQKHRLIAGSGDGQISVWDLRKSSDLNALKTEMIRKKKRILSRKRGPGQKLSKNENELLRMFEVDNELMDIKPKTLKTISDRMGDEILSLCLMKYSNKLCVGMTSGFMNIFSYGEWNWYGDRVKGHSTNLNCIVKYDEDCCITGCDDGVVRLISIYPHKFIHAIGTHDLNPIDCIAMSYDKSFVVSFASGNKRAMMNYNRTNRVSLKSNYEYSKTQKEIIKVWDMNWHPVMIYNERQETKKAKYNRRRHMNQCRLARGVKEFLELGDDDFSFTKFDDEELNKFQEGKTGHQKNMIDDYVFSDDSLDESDGSESDENNDVISEESHDEDDHENELKLEESDDDIEGQRRIRYKKFENRDDWIKHLGKRKKIRRVGQHDVDQYHKKKFFRSLWT